ncbi:MAG: ABC transporter permease [Gemmatimonadaceae bacterium]
MTPFLDDVRIALRRLAAHPGFALTTILSLGLGVGVNATVFSAANAFLIQPLQVPRSGEMVRVYNGHHSPFNFRDFDELRRRSKSFSHLFAESQSGASFAVGGEPERVRVSLMSGNTFAGLQSVPAIGRLFMEDNDRVSGTAPQVVLSHAFWHRRFGGDSQVVGSTIRLNGRAFQVLGVAAQGLRSSMRGWNADLFVAIRDSRAFQGTVPDSIQGLLYVTGRLAAGRSLDDAQTEVSVIAAQLRQERSSDRGFSVSVKPARGVTEEVRLPFAMASALLLSVSLLVLVIAATNVGNLMMARNAARRRELGVRLALGASRGRMLRLLLTEATVLAAAAAVTALLLASWSTALLPRVLPADFEVQFNIAPDWRVLLFTGLVALGALLLFGLIPARHAARTDVVESLKQSATIGGADGTRIRRRFLLAQVALCSLLLATASLFVRSLSNAGRIDIGFTPAGVLVSEIDLEGRSLDQTQRIAFFERVLSEARELRGVDIATLSMVAELTGSMAETTLFREGAIAGDSVRPEQTAFNSVGADYHRTLGIPLVRGRDLAITDVAGSPPVAVVNETFAARQWPGEDPIGKRFSLEGASGPWIEVVGLSRNVKYHTLGEDPKMFVAVPMTQMGARRMWLELRLADGASARDIGAAVQRLVRQLDPALAPPRPQLLTEAQRVVLLPARLGAAMLGGIGVLAIVLAGVGVGGVAAYTVTQRTREIGVRIALGARPAAMLRTVLRDTWRTVLFGSIAGLALAMVSGKLIANQLYGISFVDPLTFVVVPVLLVAMAVGAVAIPARRAISIQPTEALRSE